MKQETGWQVEGIVDDDLQVAALVAAGKWSDRAARWKAAAKKYRAERERERAVLNLTEWQRVYLAVCIVQSEIEDKETWLEVMKDVDEKEVGYIECRLDALRKLKAFLDGCGKQEGGQA